MEPTTRHLIRRTALILCLSLAAPALGAEPPAPRPAAVTIVGADAEDTRAIEWALKRFRLAGLAELPPLEVHVHRSAEGCRGGLGYHLRGRIDLCTKESSEPYAQKFALHEMTHAWTEAHLDRPTLERFMQDRGISSWNERGTPWKERGIEQVAEVLTWGLGAGEVAPLLPEPVEPVELSRLYELLTGRAPITPTG